MRLLFHIEYFAPAEESLHIVFESEPSLPMLRCDGGEWVAECDAECGETYHYELHNRQGEVIRREAFSHEVACGVTEIFDAWQDTPAEQPLYSSFFTDCVFARKAKPQKRSKKVSKECITIEVAAPTVRPDEVVALTGACEALGCWRIESAVIMCDKDAPIWRATLPLDRKSTRLNSSHVT